VHTIGKTPDELKPPPVPLIISFFSAMLNATRFEWLIQAMAVNGAPGGVTVGAAVGINLIATAMTSDNVFFFAAGASNYS
jgi:hypothetical protein